MDEIRRWEKAIEFWDTAEEEESEEFRKQALEWIESLDDDPAWKEFLQERARRVRG